MPPFRNSRKERAISRIAPNSAGSRVERNQRVLSQGAEAKIILTSHYGVNGRFRETNVSRAGGNGLRAKSRIEQGTTQENKFIIKDRISKSYRLPKLDDSIRRHRTKSETKLLQKASEIICAPIPTTHKEIFQIHMPFIDGKRLSEHLDKFSLTKQKQICKQIGKSIAKLHDANIIHGDLTTSNMILVENLPARSRSQIDKTNNKKNLSIKNSLGKKSAEADFEAINRASAPIIYFIDFGLGYISTKPEDKAVDLHLLRQALEAKHFKHWEELFEKVLKNYKKSKDSKIILERLKAVEKRGRYKH